MASNIRWKRSDYLRLGRAVADFNRKIKKFETEENKIYLPATMNYKEVKESILSRNKLNDVLRSLRSFNQYSAEPIVNQNTGLVTTMWELQENQIKSTRAQKNLVKQGKVLSQILSTAKQNKKNFSAKERQEMRLQYLELLEDLRDIKSYNESAGLPYQTYKKMISNLGDIDYSMLKATIYRQNFENALESFKDFKGYDLLKSKLNRLNNPVYFYRYINKSNAEFLKDIFLHYKEGEGLVMSSADNTEQMKFNEALENLGLIEESKKKLLKGYKNATPGFIQKIESIQTADDLFEFMDTIVDEKKLNKVLGIK